MKRTTSLPAFFFFFFFLVFAFTTRAKLVYDTDGKPLLNGGEYYLSPPGIRGLQILFTAIKRETTEDCSLAVVAALYEYAWPTIISMPYLIEYITTEFPLNISFAHLAPNICTNTSKWLVIESQPLGLPVMVGDAKEFSEPVVKGWFHIKPYDNKYYKLDFCTTSGNCGDIGIHIDDEEKYSLLVVTNKNSQVFKFDKVKESSGSGISMVA